MLFLTLFLPSFLSFSLPASVCPSIHPSLPCSPRLDLPVTRAKGKEDEDGPSRKTRFPLGGFFARATRFLHPSDATLVALSLSNLTPRPHHPQSPAATRLLLLGLPRGRYYPCGSFAMSFTRRLIDGAKNSDEESDVRSRARIDSLPTALSRYLIIRSILSRRCFSLIDRRR